MKREYVSYNEAKEIVQKSHIVGEKLYRTFVKSNTYRLPLHPERTYKDDGFTWGDFWGKEEKVDFLTYDECKKLLIDAGVKNNKDFRVWYSSHKNCGVPATPDIIYKKSGEWTTWGDFLDSGNIYKGTYLSYIDAKKILVENNINSQSKYNKFRKEHTEYNLPASPNVIYAKSGEWTTWGDFLDSGFVATQLREYVSYSEAKKIVQDAGISSVKEFKKWIVEHPEVNIPNNPQTSHNYSSEWEGWGVFLGTYNVSGREYKDYKLSLLESGDLLHMSSHQLIEIIANKKLPQEFKVLAYSPADSDTRIGKINELIALYESDKSDDEIDDEIYDMMDTAEESLENSENEDDLIYDDLYELSEELKKAGAKEVYLHPSYWTDNKALLDHYIPDEWLVVIPKN